MDIEIGDIVMNENGEKMVVLDVLVNTAIIMKLPSTMIPPYLQVPELDTFVGLSKTGESENPHE